MNKQLLLSIGLLMAIIAPLQAQDFQIPRFQVSLSYFGEMVTHSGIRIGLTTPISQQVISKDAGTSVNKAWMAGGHLTFYRHPRNHSAVMLTASIGRQRIGASGFQIEVHMEGGYMLSLLDGEAFEWAGSEFAAGSRGSSHLVFGFNGGAGWNFNKTTDLPLSFMVSPHVYIQAPYNTFLIPRLALEASVSYSL